jgi:glycosyltransferase involved in cell wall biosynthesis
VVIPALDEAPNLDRLLPELHERLSWLGLTHELLVVDGGSSDGTADVVRRHGARVISQERGGYGGALQAGFAAAGGEFVITLDADGSHDAATVSALWEARARAEVVVASRYVRGGAARMPIWRYLLSRALNLVFRAGLSLPVRDVSSGYRLYARRVVAGADALQAGDFDVLEEILIRAMAAGYRIIEVPFSYQPRRDGRSHARVFHVGRAYLRTLLRMWRLRNSIAAADYDARAYDSLVPLQRYWQRRRYAVITRLADGFERVLDVGCGSSRILGSQRSMVGLDVALGKLRYSRRYGNPLVHGSIFAIPFEDASFDCVVCSEVIEHIPPDEQAFAELRRVLRPGGRLLLGTPDYDRWTWRALEWLYARLAPGGYADEHITHYGRKNLAAYLASVGFAVEGVHYVGGAEMIFSLRKLAALAPAVPLPVTTALRAA